MKKIFSGFPGSIRKITAAAAAAALMLAGSAAADGAKTIPTDLMDGKNRVAGAPYKETLKTNPEVYEDPTIRVEWHRVNHKDENGVYNEYNTTYFYALISIKDASQIRTAPADEKGFYGRTRAEGKRIAKWYNAVLAINGDFYSYYMPGDGNKYCLRQGTVYRDTVAEKLDMLLIDEDGDFHIYKAGPELAELNKKEVDGKKVINAFQFGPALVIDGEPVPDEIILDRNHAPSASDPDRPGNMRMCIAQVDTLQYLVLASWEGLTLANLRDLVLSITPVKTLYVLDGGNSSQIIYLGSQVNIRKGENDRTISDIIYFASANFPD